MSQECCPYCGSGAIPNPIMLPNAKIVAYGCGYLEKINDDGTRHSNCARPSACYEAQIARLTREKEVAEEALVGAAWELVPRCHLAFQGISDCPHEPMVAEIYASNGRDTGGSYYDATRVNVCWACTLSRLREDAIADSQHEGLDTSSQT